MTPRGSRNADVFDRRQRHMGWLAVAFGVALFSRTLYLKTVRAEHFARVAEESRTVARAFAPRRGEILGANDEPLAQTKDCYQLVFDPVTFRGQCGDVRGPHATRAAAILSSLVGMAQKDILAIMQSDETDTSPGAASAPTSASTRGPSRRRLVVKDELTPDEAAAVRYALEHNLRKTRTDPHPLSGFGLSVVNRRVSLADRASAPVLGRVTQGPRAMRRGIGGIEDWADTVLAGSVGRYEGVSAAAALRGDRAEVLKADPVPGMDVRTTLDVDVQRILGEELRTCMQEHTPLGATAIVLDPWTGAVVGMASEPSLDIAAPDAGRLLLAQPELMRNRALMLYEPGSVLKPITVSLALEHGLVTPTQDIPCQQSFVPGSRPVRCEAHRSAAPAPGTNVPRMIVAKSCNVAAAKLALRIGARRMHEGLRRFGLLDKTGIELPGETVGRSLTDPYRGRCYPDDLARVGFGQGITVSPLGLTAAFAAIVNGGILHRPYLLRSYGYPGQPPAREYRPEPGRHVLRPWVAKEVRSYLGSVVQLGTGKPARLPGYTTGGKTGTAQKVKGRGYAGYIASFIGAVPLSHPRAVIAVVVDEPHNGYHGSQAAAPTWARIARRLMMLWHVSPDATTQAGAIRPTRDSNGTQGAAD